MVGGAGEKSLDNFRVADAGQLSALLGESPDEVSERLIQLLATTLEVPGVPGHMYVPWKFPTKIFTKSRQLWICKGGRCSSQARTESDRNKGRLRMMSRSSFAPPS